MDETSYLQKCTPHQLSMIYDEFKITQESLDNTIRELKIWLNHEPHLPNDADEIIIKNYYLRCKADIDRTKSHLELYYTTKAKLPELFSNRNVQSTDFKKCFKLTMMLPLPKLTEEGFRVFIFRVNDHSKFGKDDMPSSNEYLKAIQICSLLNLRYDLCKKHVVLCDFSQISLSYISLLLLSLRKLITLATKVIPYRYHRIYVVNAIPAVRPIISLAKTLSKKEIGDRIEIWKKEPEEFAEIFPKEILPPEYGGTAQPLDTLNEMWYDELKKYTSWLHEEEKQIADLDKKKEKRSWINKFVSQKNSLSPETEVVAESSFQNLNID